MKRMKSRKIAARVTELAGNTLGRILVFTGARQTGKTTLARALFPDYAYLSIEDPVLRGQYAQLTAGQWKRLYPRAILDEVQKAPLLVESVKSVYDQWAEPRYILLGSSQLRLLEKVRESLAGRCVIVELFPLTVPEIATEDWNEQVEDSLLQQFLNRPDNMPELLPSFVLDEKMARKDNAWGHYVRFGGYPALTRADLDDEERYLWLREYVRTYLERDVRDLSMLRVLEPFLKLQKFLALRTAQTLNVSAAAVQVGLSAKTVRRYIHYFEISYQALVVPAWSRNSGKRLTGAAKLHYLDNGVLQAVLQKRGGLTGAEFESLVVAEIYKQLHCARIEAALYHLRTHDGFEVDLLLELPGGYVAFEIKMAEKARPSDARNLKKLDGVLDKPLLGGFLLSNDCETHFFAPNICAVNAAYFLG
jgi:predicted AAA+ superfamily ATPase